MAYPSSEDENVVKVLNAADLSGPIDSTKLYKIMGDVDLGDGSIDVPETGINIDGLGFGISKLRSTGPIFTYSGAYAGDVQGRDFSMVSPSVFALVNDGNGAFEFNDCNFEGCASLGYATAYRQGLFTGVGVILCDDGLEIRGAWPGGFTTVTSIIIGMAGGTLFKEGASLSIGGSFRSNINAVSLDSTGALCDFQPSTITNDGAFSMEGVRVNPLANAFPNMPASSPKARFRNCDGVSNTYPGGEFISTADGVTTVALADTLYQITATGTGENLDWTSIANTNGIQYDSTQEISVVASGTMSFSGANNDQLGLQLRKWDNALSQYTNIGPEYAATLNGGQAGTRAENVSFKATTKVKNGDRIEVWIKNKSAATDITTLSGGEFSITER